MAVSGPIFERTLARLPVFTYWTTNYDKLIEKALEDAKKVPDVKYDLKQLSVTRPGRDAVVYKMHGDIDHPATAVINRDDYEAYPEQMDAFVSALRGDLAEKTFLFLGFSFTDPNIDYILSRVRVQFGENQRRHYCIQRRASPQPADTFRHRQLKQDYFIGDLKRFGIFTVLVDEYSEIASLLEKLKARSKPPSVFISGAAVEYAPWTRQAAEEFVNSLGYQLASQKNRIVTGFGAGVGPAVINGVLAHLQEAGRAISDENLLMRPFPYMTTSSANLPHRRREYRQTMIDHASIAVFVFGNKRDAKGNVVPSSGMQQEFDLCVQAGVSPLPVGATGWMSRTLWEQMTQDLARYFPDATPKFTQDFQDLGDSTKSPEQLLATVLGLIGQLQKG